MSSFGPLGDLPSVSTIQNNINNAFDKPFCTAKMANDMPLFSRFVMSMSLACTTDISLVCHQFKKTGTDLNGKLTLALQSCRAC
jgi:hypothetical protein